jgi:hypothetical protein
MQPFSPEQIAIIRSAVQSGRAAVQRQRCDDPCVFARAFIAENGVQIPSQPQEQDTAQRVAQQVLRVLRTGEPLKGDEDVAREAHRARIETRLALSLSSERSVGFTVRLGPQAQSDPACRVIIGEDLGLGAAVFPMNRVVVMPPWCLDYDFTPISEDEIEQ